MGDWNHIRIDRDGWLASLTLSRPPVNALSRDMVGELVDAAEEITGDNGVSVVIIRSDQQQFCAGADLKEREAMQRDQVSGVVESIRHWFDMIARLPQPTIASVHSGAIGGGAELALACDLRLMSDDVRFGFSEVSLGIIPGGGGTQRLPRLIGLSKAKELIFTARLLDSSECLRLGLADRVVPRPDLDQSVAAFAKDLTRNAPLALRAAKRAIIEGYDLPLEKALGSEGQAYDSLIRTKDREEGLKAFLEKRTPLWKGE
ncbi:MAG: enoyl-CoA hydratase/isomerase family protein [Fidelibacterota bacterium]|nr:MAG: enoyl-CoA hydratase/isomerase family protein [Candidatus Neomarinimicrobiota bacterium]